MNKDLLLTTEQLNEIVWNNTDKDKQTYALGTIIQQVAQAELNHLAELGIVYTKEDKDNKIKELQQQNEELKSTIQAQSEYLDKLTAQLTYKWTIELGAKND